MNCTLLVFCLGWFRRLDPTLQLELLEISLFYARLSLLKAYLKHLLPFMKWP